MSIGEGNGKSVVCLIPARARQAELMVMYSIYTSPSCFYI